MRQGGVEEVGAGRLGMGGLGVGGRNRQPQGGGGGEQQGAHDQPFFDLATAQAQVSPVFLATPGKGQSTWLGGPPTP